VVSVEVVVAAAAVAVVAVAAAEGRSAEARPLPHHARFINLKVTPFTAQFYKTFYGRNLLMF